MRNISLLVAAPLLACLIVTGSSCNNAAKPNPSAATQPVTSTQPRDDGTGGNGPKVSFFGNSDNAHHVVFVIDASGSMAFAIKNGGSVFDAVREEMLKSIKQMTAEQDFHVVFFQEGPLVQLPPTQLQPATAKSHTVVEHWMDEVVPHGAGDRPIPAIIRAFDALSRADNSHKGKTIFFLTDGSFPDNDAVLRCIKEQNKAKDVRIFTYLYGVQNDESAVKLMKDIATETGGQYKNITD